MTFEDESNFLSDFFPSDFCEISDLLMTVVILLRKTYSVEKKLNQIDIYFGKIYTYVIFYVNVKNTLIIIENKCQILWQFMFKNGSYFQRVSNLVNSNISYIIFKSYI